MLLNTTYYPIIGDLRIILLVMEYIIVGIALEFALFFLLRVVMEKNKLKTVQEKAYIWLFLGYSAAWFIFILSDYYVDPSIRLDILNIGYFSLMCCAGLFIFYIERIKILLKKYFFSMIFVIMIILYIILMLYSVEIATLMSHAMWPAFLLFFVFYMKELISSAHTKGAQGNFNKNFIKFILGAFFLVGGYQLTLGWALRYIGIGIRLVGDIMQLIGLLFLLLFFLSVPSFSEYDWKEKIESIYITHKGGILLYKKLFREKEEDIEPNIISGTLISIKVMLDKMTDLRGISIIEREQNVVMYNPGDFFTVILFCDENLISLQILIKSFLEKIESMYKEVMKTWKGEIGIFAPIEEVVQDFFY